MNVLVINAGSSSLKYQLLDTKTREVYAKGNCERIGIDGSFVGHEERGGGKQKLEVALPDHKTAVKYVFQILDEAGFDTSKIEGRSSPTRRWAGSARSPLSRRCTTTPRPTSSRSAARCSPPSAT